MPSRQSEAEVVLGLCKLKVLLRPVLWDGPGLDPGSAEGVGVAGIGAWDRARGIARVVEMVMRTWVPSTATGALANDVSSARPA